MESSAGTHDQTVLPARPSSVPIARKWVEDHLSDLTPPPATTEVAGLLATELVTNAVLYASGDTIAVTLAIDAPLVRVEVHDHSPAASVAPKDFTSEATSGRGLKLVETFAHRWGIGPASVFSPGKSVWFELLH